MNIDIQPGRYIVAVSGGVDSVVLLHMLTRLPRNTHQFTVAHFDHGIRKDSSKDRMHVANLAKQYDLPFVYDEGNLGPGASEAEARKARYAFLYRVRDMAQAQAIITAHHQDDMIETAILNLLRGTGRKGVSSLRSTDIVKRPLLHLPKTEIHNYAKAHKLTWREDSTNTDTKYKRNYVRHNIVPKLTQAQRKELLHHIHMTRALNEKIDAELTEHLKVQPHKSNLDRKHFTQLPHAVAVELLAAWLRQHGVRNFDRKGLQRMVTQAKTLQASQQIDINVDYVIAVTKTHLTLIPRITKVHH